MTGVIPDTALVRQWASRPRITFNLEQELSPGLGAFAKISYNDGSQEAYEFTDVNKSLSLGVALKGNAWNRPADTVALATAFNCISAPARAYFAAGGLGIPVGDGQLPHSSSESIVESFYSLRLVEQLTVSANYQYVVYPAYNRDRGPVSIVAVRIHAEF